LIHPAFFFFQLRIPRISRIGEHGLVRAGLTLPVGFGSLAETIFEKVRDPCPFIRSQGRHPATASRAFSGDSNL
jgi:hypothetical protein